MKDTQLFQRATKMARNLAGTEAHQASKVIRALISRCNQADRELSEWRSGRMAKALAKENESLRAANRYLQDMIRKQRGDAA